MTRHKAWGRLSSLPGGLERLSHSTEMRFVVGVTIVLLAVTSIPYVYGHLSCPPDKWFSGVVFNMHDTAQYLSWMREAGTSFFTDNKLTAEPNARVFVNLHWWIPGRLACIFGLSFAQVYQLFRLVAVPLLTVVTYAFCALLFSDRRERWFAFLLSTFTSGLGWVWVVLKYATKGTAPFFPFDIYATPGNAFWVMLASPHLTFATALTMGVLLLALLSVQRRRFGYAVGAAGLALFLGLGHIYDLVTVWAVLALFGLLLMLRDGWSWHVFFSLGLVVLVSAPAALYWGWVSSDAHPAWKQALSQYGNLGAFTPAPVHLMILLGLTFLIDLATFEGFVPLSEQSDNALLIKGWFVAVPLLVYLPLHFQIMLLTGCQLPMAALATVGLFDHMLPWLRERLPTGFSPSRLTRAVPMLFLLAVSLTNLYLLLWRVTVLSRHDYPFYLSADDRGAMRWLEENTDPGEVVLSAFVTGHYIPGLAGNRPFLANAVMTLNFNYKRRLMQRFYGGDMTAAEQKAFLQEYNIRYLLWGPAERALGQFNPDESSLFELVFQAPRTRVYRVKVPWVSSHESGFVLRQS